MTEGKDESKVYLYFVGKRGYGADKVEINERSIFGSSQDPVLSNSVCLSVVV